MTIHSCVEVKGKGAGCKECPVMAKGLCLDLIDFIQRAESSSKKKFSGISEFDRLSIIADTVSAIVAKIDTFKGDSLFSTSSQNQGIVQKILPGNCHFFHQKYV